MDILGTLRDLALESGFAAFFVTDGGWTFEKYSKSKKTVLDLTDDALNHGLHGAVFLLKEREELLASSVIAQRPQSLS